MSRAPALAALVALALAAVAVACSGSSDDGRSREAGADPFGYDRSAPLAVQERTAELRDNVDVREISFAARPGVRISGYLVVPLERGRYPAVIYLHGDFGGRGDFLDQAVEIARRGAVALTLDAPYSQRRRERLPLGIAGLRRYAALIGYAVVETRRAVDLLAARQDVDARRIGLVGWSAGARTAAILAGVERRIQAFDFFAGGAASVTDYAAAAPAELRAEVAGTLRRVDPLRYVARAAPARLLFQNGRRDEVVPREALLTLYRAASRPKEIRWYDADHTPSDRALADSRKWLVQQLGIGRTR